MVNQMKVIKQIAHHKNKHKSQYQPLLRSLFNSFIVNSFRKAPVSGLYEEE